jgi:aminopeptidase N
VFVSGIWLRMLSLLAGVTLLVGADGVDPRSAYDVDTYRLDLSVDPATKTLSGTVGVDVHVTADETSEIVLDLAQGFEVSGVLRLDRPVDSSGVLAGAALEFTYTAPLLYCRLPNAAKKGESVRLAVAYSGSPRSRDSFTGFHWKTTADGKPWITTSCQDTGSASWWPSKDSYFHPEDKPARVFENYTVPVGLYAVGNGRLESREVHANETETFRWVHEYPLETYSIALNVAPYVVVEKKLDIEGVEAPLEFIYYVLPENAEKAALQFQDVEPMIEAYSAAFGPFPFPKAKYALVETSFWGMEHSTAVAYGSSYPAWLALHGGKDPHGSRNKYFDYILVHESAHEWWGNAVSAKTWGDFWIHEGFATYAEDVYLERVKGRETADRHMQSWKSSVGKSSRLYRGENVDSGSAYNINLYSKGAWVLHTLRTYVANDAQFFGALRAFNLEYRYKNASTDDFRAIVERETKREWKRFCDEWVYGKGYPKLDGTVRIEGTDLVLDVTVSATSETSFHVPLDVALDGADGMRSLRIELEPGHNERRIAVGERAAARLSTIQAILCDSLLKVE